MVKIIVTCISEEAAQNVVSLLNKERNRDPVVHFNISDIKINNNKIDPNKDKEYFELETL